MTGTRDTIVLHGSAHEPCISRDHVYFTFASGRFDYDCVSCQAKCCRGFGYQLNLGQELHEQLRARPAVRFFLHARDAIQHGYQVHNCPPACFFLDQENRCAIQTAHGHGAKPETCRLFPFNYLRRAGAYLIVTPHLSLCPLRTLAPSARSAHSDHGALFEAMTAYGIAAQVPVVTPIVQNVPALIALERRILEYSEEHLAARSYLAFATQQLRAADDDREHLQIRRSPSHAVSLERFASTLCDVLGVGHDFVSNPNPVVLRCVVAATPSLRAQLLFPGKGTGRVSIEHVPRLLLALCVLVELAAEAGQREVTYQTVMRIFQENLSLLIVLAHVECEVAWRPTEMIDLPTIREKDQLSRYVQTLKALLPARQRRAQRTLGSILCEYASPDGVARVLLLRQLADRLHDRITLLSDLVRPSLWSRAFRPVLQHWAFNKLSDASLMQLAGRRMTPRNLPATS
jgi:Fe-S-cluster containining protein